MQLSARDTLQDYPALGRTGSREHSKNQILKNFSLYHTKSLKVPFHLRTSINSQQNVGHPLRNKEYDASPEHLSKDYVS